MPLSRLAGALSPFMDRRDRHDKRERQLRFRARTLAGGFSREGALAAVALAPQAIQMAEAASGDSLFNPWTPIEVLVIDRAEKTPSENWTLWKPEPAGVGLTEDEVNCS